MLPFSTTITTKQCHAFIYSLLFHQSAIAVSKAIYAHERNCLSKNYQPRSKWKWFALYWCQRAD